MPIPNTATDTSFQVQLKSAGQFLNLGPIQTNYDTALAFANVAANGTGTQPVQIIGLQTGQIMTVISRGNG